MKTTISIDENRLAPSNLPIDITIKSEDGMIINSNEKKPKVKSKAKTKSQIIAKPAKEKRSTFKNLKENKAKQVIVDTVDEGGATEILSNVFIERLVLEFNSPKGNVEIEVARNEFYIGKDINNDIVIDFNPAISRRHCKITNENDQYYAEDLGSANGTFINRMKLKEDKVPIKHDDQLMLANTILTVKER